MPFRFLEHTADVRVECEAESLPALFETAAQAFYAITLRTRDSDTNIERSLLLSGSGLEDLLIRFLQELVFLLETDYFAVSEFEFHAISPEELRATLRGYRCMPEDRAEEVKSATYHGLEVTEIDGRWTARVIFDL